VFNVFLIDVVSGRIVENDRESDVVGIVDDIAWRHRGYTHKNLANGRNLTQKNAAILHQLISRGGGCGRVKPEVDVMNEHSIIVVIELSLAIDDRPNRLPEL